MNIKPPFDVKILDYLATAIIVFDDKLQVQYINQTAESLLDISAKHAIGEKPADIMACNDEALIALVDNIEGTQVVTKRGITLRTGVLREITVDCVISHFTEPSGDSYRLMELQQVDHQLRISRENQLISQEAVTRDMVRGLAHEIKNPLGGLRGAAQLLEAELSDIELKEYTTVIIDEADRLQALVNQMLGPNRRPDYQRVNIHHVLERVRTLMLAEAGEQVKINRDYDPSIPELIGDMGQLIQAVLNIVGNAIKAINGLGTISLLTRVERNFTIGGSRHRLVARIEIKDTGRGIPAEIAETLFFPMVTSGDGLGLGLSITQSLITQHKGLVECRSKPGETVFTILLPLAH